jgi:hypothetical protein
MRELRCWGLATVVSSMALAGPPAADAGIQDPAALAESACYPDGYDAKRCAQATESLEQKAAAEASNEAVQLALARAYLGSAYHHAPSSPDFEPLRQKGVTLLRKLVSGGTKSAAIYLRLAAQTTDEKERAALTTKAAELEPNSAEALRSLAFQQLRLKDMPAALKSWERFRKSEPQGDWEEELAWANALARAGHMPEATAAAEQALQGQGHGPASERCAAAVGVESKLLEAPALAAVTRDVLPYCTHVEHLAAAAAFARKGQAAEAIREAEAQLAENPKPPDTYFFLARLYAKQDAKKATAVLTTYFASEKDAQERCMRFSSMARAERTSLEAQTSAELVKSCSTQ